MTKPPKNVILDNKPKKPRYAKNDLGSVYTHYDPELRRNVPTPNILPKEVNNGKSS